MKGDDTMKKYFLSLLKKYEDGLSAEGKELEALRSELLIHIGFMQHERLIHFLVTMLFAIVMFICIAGVVCFDAMAFFPILALILCLLIPYIAHYFFLENNVQKLYGIYDKYTEKITEKTDE